MAHETAFAKHRAFAAAWPKLAERVEATMCMLRVSAQVHHNCHMPDVRCRQTGQYHPFAFFFLRSRPVVVVPPATGGFVVPAAVVVAGVAPVPPAAAASPSAFAPSSRRATLPPAPNSTMPTAHSRQTTKCRQGRRTTSRGDVKHTMHSFGVEAYGSSPPVGGYEEDWVCVEDERP